MRNSILASFCRIFALTLTCGLLTGIAAETESTDGLTAQQILDKMAANYATCKSYRDSGVVTNFFSLEHIDVKPFRTAFVRPDQFRFEYDDPDPEKPYVVWAKGDEVRSWWYIRPGVQNPPSLGRGIAGVTGVSSGSAHTIPTLLLPDQIGGRSMASLTDLTRLPDEAVDDTLCFKLQGKFADQPTTLWLEKETYLIRRIVEETKLTRATTVYRPEVDKEIPAEELAFKATDQDFQTSPVNARPNSLALPNIGSGEIILILVLLFILAVVAVGFLGLIYLIVRAVVNRPPPATSTLPSSVATENQQRRDREHVKLLAIFHFVFAGLAFVGIGFLCVHYGIMHTVFSNPDIWKSQPQIMPPKAFLDAFIWFYLFMGVLLLTGLALNVLSGIFLLRKRNRVFSLVIGGLNCLQIPFGTALGVFTILVLSRDSVRQLYSGPASTFGPSR
jgi:outer membrane lipoprotein-sorting protein